MCERDWNADFYDFDDLLCFLKRSSFYSHFHYIPLTIGIIRALFFLNLNKSSKS